MLTQRSHGKVSFATQSTAELGTLVILHVLLEVLERQRFSLLFIFVFASAAANVRERARVQAVLHYWVQFLQIVTLALTVRAASHAIGGSWHRSSGPA